MLPTPNADGLPAGLRLDYFNRVGLISHHFIPIFKSRCRTPSWLMPYFAAISRNVAPSRLMCEMQVSRHVLMTCLGSGLFCLFQVAVH